jgi:hypothetical protein
MFHLAQHSHHRLQDGRRVPRCPPSAALVALAMVSVGCASSSRITKPPTITTAAVVATAVHTDANATVTGTPAVTGATSPAIAPNSPAAGVATSPLPTQPIVTQPSTYKTLTPPPPPDRSTFQAAIDFYYRNYLDCFAAPAGLSGSRCNWDLV